MALLKPDCAYVRSKMAVQAPGRVFRSIIGLAGQEDEVSLAEVRRIDTPIDLPMHPCVRPARVIASGARAWRQRERAMLGVGWDDEGGEVTKVYLCVRVFFLGGGAGRGRGGVEGGGEGAEIVA